MVMVAKGQRLWLASVVGDGGRSTEDFNAILQSWRLP
jgi:hypothetical protein